MNAIDYQNELEKRDEKIKLLEAEIEELKRLLNGKALAKAAKKPKFSENYSLDKNIGKKRRRKKSTGRRKKDAKRSLIQDISDVYQAGIEREKCVLRREHFAWRIIDGKATYIAYRIYDLPNSKKLPLPSGLRSSRSEFGIEIILTLAFLHYWVGVSIDHACETMRFFTGLELSKSQADSLLSQLANDWNREYDTIAELIALQTIVYIDETGWKVGRRSCYTWVFSTAMHVLFRTGVGRGKVEAEQVLGTFFNGIGVTDDYAAYKSLFSRHQLCWAHLIRKAIKLALQHPDEKEYATFLDELCEIYRQAVRCRKDSRLSVGRETRSYQLQGEVRSLCTRSGEAIDKKSTPDHKASFIRLQNELVDNIDCLFVFVEHPDVEPTNNRSEQNARREAEVRKGGRTSKTASGAKRRSVIMTVIATLRTRFSRFTLGNLLSEVKQWLTDGRSIFEQELLDLRRANAPPV